jgi:hypothetical protein
MDHLLWAVACLAVTGAAILASLVTVFGRLVF